MDNQQDTKNEVPTGDKGYANIITVKRKDTEETSQIKQNKTHQEQLTFLVHHQHDTLTLHVTTTTQETVEQESTSNSDND